MRAATGRRITRGISGSSVHDYQQGYQYKFRSVLFSSLWPVFPVQHQGTKFFFLLENPTALQIGPSNVMQRTNPVLCLSKYHFLLTIKKKSYTKHVLKLFKNALPHSGRIASHDGSVNITFISKEKIRKNQLQRGRESYFYVKFGTSREKNTI